MAIRRDFHIVIKSVFDPPEPGDGMRVYVERRKPTRRRWESLSVDRHEVALAPQSDLERLNLHDRDQWIRFRTLYERQLAHSTLAHDAFQSLAEAEHPQPITLLYARGDHAQNAAHVIKELLLARHDHRSS